MIIFAFAIFGAILGVSNARKRKGTRLDMAQYGASYGIAFLLLGVFVTIIVERIVT